jgi:uncharacterized linocin/CFP29 family protein
MVANRRGSRAHLQALVAGRRVIDVKTPGGVALPGIGTGHQTGIASPKAGVLAKLYDVKALVQLTIPLTLQRESIDSVKRGSDDGDWQPAKDATNELALAEDSMIFDGYAAAGIVGIREGSSNAAVDLPADVKDYPIAIGATLEKLRLAGVDGPYSVLLGADAYTALSEASDKGYPVIEHIKRIVSGDLVWAPALKGGCALSTRGGDYELHIGQDLSIGYSSHTDTTVQLYLRETLTFLMLTSEASVSLAAIE